MSAIGFKEKTTSTPEQFVAALTDFGPGRSKIFGSSAHPTRSRACPVASRSLAPPHYYDSRRVERIYRMTLDDGIWQIWREESGFWRRFTATIASTAA
jgi:hypothetical protein